MGRSRESFNKKEVRTRKEKKRKDKEKKRLERKDNEKKGSLDDMIAYVDEEGRISSTPPEPGSKKEIEPEDIEVSIPKNEHAERPDPIRQGVVSFFNVSKGFGFIRDAETNQSIFVHVNDLLEQIQEGSAVSFEIVPGKKGPAAVRVRLVKEAKM